MIDEAALREAVCATGRDLYRLGFVAGRTGNISARLDADHLLVTPAGSHKGKLTPRDLVVVALDGGGHPRATTELPMHRASYEARADVGAAIHAHAPALTAAGIRNVDIAALLPEVGLAVGAIDTVEFLPSGSDLLGFAVGRAVGAGAAIVLLRNHGVLAVDESVRGALDRLETAELAARAVLLAG